MTPEGVGSRGGLVTFSIGRTAVFVGAGVKVGGTAVFVGSAVFVAVAVGGCVGVGWEVCVLVGLFVIVGRTGEDVAVAETAVAGTVASVMICAGVIWVAQAVNNKTAISKKAGISPENNLVEREFGRLFWAFLLFMAERIAKGKCSVKRI